MAVTYVVLAVENRCGGRWWFDGSWCGSGAFAVCSRSTLMLIFCMPLNFLSFLFFCCCFCLWFCCLPSGFLLLSLEFTWMLLIFFALPAFSHCKCEIQIPHRWKTKCNLRKRANERERKGREKKKIQENKYFVKIHSIHSDFTIYTLLCVINTDCERLPHFFSRARFFYSPMNVKYVENALAPKNFCLYQKMCCNVPNGVCVRQYWRNDDRITGQKENVSRHILCGFQFQHKELNVMR